ncbi:MAG: hypothetical protein ACQER7_01240, partial [Bacteroidota bacterium]
VIWSGPLNRENVNLLLDSPVRESIAGKLAGDASAVWVLLESGDKQKDRAALNLLEKEINRLEQTLELSNFELWGDSQDIKDENIPGIKFEIFSVSRHDSGEEYLVEMLLNSEDDLKEIESEPIVFPVYGRGIALYAIVGEGINKWNLREAAEFLTGDCSCQAKAGNPGVDLLLSMDWDKHIENLTNLGTANPLSGMGDFRNKEEEVKRRLDSATIKRLGTKSKKRESRETDPEKVVLLDISSDNKQENEEMADADTVAENDKALATGPGDKKTNKEKEKQQEQKPVDLELSDKESSKGSVEEPKEKWDLKQKFMLALAGVIGLVLLGGIVLYYKNIK